MSGEWQETFSLSLVTRPVALQQQCSSFYHCSATWTVVTSRIPPPVFKNSTGACIAESWDAIGSCMWCVVGWTNQKLAWPPSPLPHFLNTELVRWSSPAQLPLCRFFLPALSHRTHLPTSFTTELTIMWLKMPIIPPAFLPPTPSTPTPVRGPRPISDNAWMIWILLAATRQSSAERDPLLRFQESASWWWQKITIIIH